MWQAIKLCAGTAHINKKFVQAFVNFRMMYWCINEEFGCYYAKWGAVSHVTDARERRMGGSVLQLPRHLLS